MQTLPAHMVYARICLTYLWFL